MWYERNFAENVYQSSLSRSVLALLGLIKKYDRVRLEAACRRALEIGSPTRTSVESILKKGLDNKPLELPKDTDLQDDLFLQEHQNVRGPTAFQYAGVQ